MILRVELGQPGTVQAFQLRDVRAGWVHGARLVEALPQPAAVPGVAVVELQLRRLLV